MSEESNKKTDEAQKSDTAAQSRRWRRFILIFLAVVLVFLPVSNAVGYEFVFRNLFKDEMRDIEANEETELKLLEDRGITRTEYRVETTKNRFLQGYYYRASDRDDSGISRLIIFSHGIGNGHIAYIDAIAEFALLPGTAVFAYDAFGNGRSDGDACGGLPQGVADLDRVITYVEESGSFPASDITLVGHSWGAYSAGSVLEFHPEIKKTVLYAGFNASENMLQEYAERYAGPVVTVMLPYVELYEMIKFGAAGNASIVRGCLQTGTEVHIIQALDDETIDPEKYGIRYLEKELSDDSDVSFTELESGGHRFLPEIVAGFLE